MTLEERLERLERQNQWMRRLGAVGAALLAAVFLMGQGKEKEKVPPDLVVRSLTVVDRDGKPRLTARTEKHGSPALKLLYADGSRAFTLHTIEGPPGVLGTTMSLGLPGDLSVTLFTLSKKMATVFTSPGGGGQAGIVSSAEGDFFVVGDKKKTRVFLGLNLERDAVLQISDNKGQPRAHLGVTTTINKVTGAETKTAEGTLTLYNAKGTVLHQRPR